MKSFLSFLSLFLLTTINSTVTANDNNNNNDNNEQYIVTIDAGSSGSRVHVHKVRVSSTSTFPTILSTSNQKIKPGLSSFESKPADAQEHVKGLVDYALEQVPVDAWSRTPIFLKATAGMRSIPPQAADQILAVVKASMAGTAFLFEDHYASVISGTDEGKFSWIATNFLKGRFGQTKDAHSPLLGVLEMGGASLQISYPLPKEVAAGQSEDIIDVHLDQTYHLYAHSFLGYGLDQAQELLAQASQEELQQCYPPGFTIHNKRSMMSSNSTSATTTTMGAGNYDKCYSAMDSILGKQTCPTELPETSKCAINGLLLPHIQGVPFVAIENFFYTTEFFETQHSLPTLPQKGQEFCQRPWADNQATYQNEDQDQLQRYCFSSAYIMALLDKGLAISTHQVEVAHKVGDTDIDWAVGSVIHDVMQLQKDRPHYDNTAPQQHTKEEASPKSNTNWRPLGWTSSMVLVAFGIALLAVVATSRRRKKDNSRYH